jgi:quercetin dioxygenase-like cupin family protein
MTSERKQTFIDPGSEEWTEFGPGIFLCVLSQPVPEGSIHRARVEAGATIPVHTHPSDEFVQVVRGTIITGGRQCEAGTFWITPAGTHQGPHVAVTDVELLTIRLGPMGTFGE